MSDLLPKSAISYSLAFGPAFSPAHARSISLFSSLPPDPSFYIFLFFPSLFLLSLSLCLALSIAGIFRKVRGRWSKETQNAAHMGYTEVLVYDDEHEVCRVCVRTCACISVSVYVCTYAYVYYLWYIAWGLSCVLERGPVCEHVQLRMGYLCMYVLIWMCTCVCVCVCVYVYMSMYNCTRYSIHNIYIDKYTDKEINRSVQSERDREKDFCVYVCVCMCVCVYTCTWFVISEDQDDAWVFIVYTIVYTWMLMCARACLRVYVYIVVEFKRECCWRANTWCPCVRVRVHVCACVCMYVRVVCVCVLL